MKSGVPLKKTRLLIRVIPSFPAEHQQVFFFCVCVQMSSRFTDTYEALLLLELWSKMVSLPETTIPKCERWLAGRNHPR